MDGFILAISSSDAARNKQQWVTVFAKADEISAKLIGFSDRSQHQVRWSLDLVGADICTPVPGEPNFGVLLDDAPYCFYVRETSASRDCTYFFSASDDATKKRWMKQLLQIAKDGPTAPRFAVTQAENEFAFCARVIKSRPHEQGSHAEYLVTCTCKVFNRLIQRRVAKEWSLWHRFSEFDELFDALQKSLGPQMNGVTFVKHKRDAFRSLVGKSLEPEFLEERRMQLDTFVAQVCEIRTAVEFFKHHCDPHLKKFFRFDEYCREVDQSPRKTKGTKSRGQRSNTQQSDGASSRASTMSARSTDVDTPRSSTRDRNADRLSALSLSEKKTRRGSKRKGKKTRDSEHQRQHGEHHHHHHHRDREEAENDLSG